MMLPFREEKKVLLIDNFDSFTYILRDYILTSGFGCDTVRNTIHYRDISLQQYAALIVSPGPNNPDKAGNLMQILEKFTEKIPVLGVCLGHQAIGQLYGWNCRRAAKPMHGKVSEINILKKEPLFENLPSVIKVMRYHSLIIEKPSAVSELMVAAETGEKEIMAVIHNRLPVAGVQFHPESALTPSGKTILQNWFKSL